ncbi:MAG: hypothetical protein J6D10_08225 [Clostridia bacterium]|nr:hypothetical protein [Clostridia bacterium]
MKNRLMSVLLAALMLSSSFAMFACGESNVNTETQTANPTASTPTAGDTADVIDESKLTDYERRQLIPDNLPAVNYDGAEFRVMTRETFAGWQYSTEIWVEELNGDACNDAVFNRNVAIEERFGVKISATEDTDAQNKIKTFVTAGTPDYHLVSYFDYQTYIPVTAGVLMNWLEAPMVDLNQPWHNKLANDGATINGILYSICSDLSITSMTYTHAIFANTGLLADFGYSTDDLYGFVKEGAWTIDKLSEMITAMYIDENGNGKADTADTYGFGYQITNPGDVWLTAFGEKVCSYTPETGIEITFMSDKTVSMLEKLLEMHYNNAGFTKLATQYDEETYFLEEKLVMAPMRFAAAYNKLRDMDAVYTMLPFPKWDENQEGYYTNADDKFSVFGLPLTSAPEIEFVSIIFEAMSAESYKMVFPAYYDQALKGKYSSDATTAEMVELIMAGRAFDFSFQFGESCFQRLPYLIRDHLVNNNPNLASAYKKLEKALNKSLDKILGKAYDLE